jgi:hypothetical protein
MNETTIELSERAKRMVEEAQDVFKRASEKRNHQQALTIGIILLLVTTALGVASVILLPLWVAERIHIGTLNLILVPSILSAVSLVVPLLSFWQYYKAHSEAKYLSRLARKIEDEMIEIQNQ